MSWKEDVYKKELEKIRVQELGHKRERELARVKTKARIVGGLRYGKRSALSNMAKKAKTRRTARAANVKKTGKPGYFSVGEWKKRIRKNYGWD